MVARPRLAPPAPQPREVWPWHTAKYALVPSQACFVRDRRMEAEMYLSSGSGIRAAIEGRATGWVRLGVLARVWMPGRLKGIQVSPNHGTPFLAATQVFDVRPVPRKWLSLSRTADAENRFVRTGMVLVTCSGSVGRPTLAHAVHEGTLISHDLLRVEAVDARSRGWLYAYLRAPQVRAMTISAHYGHIIKHLEVSHLEELPVPEVDDATSADFGRRVARIMDLRNEGYHLTLEAENRFAEALGPLKISDWGERGFPVRVSRASTAGRRLEASVHCPGVADIRRHLAKSGEGFVSIADAGYRVWVPGRYKRVPADDGVVYRDSADLLEVSPDLTKRYADCSFGDKLRGRVEAGWILMPCSGQVYGIIGTAILATEALHGQVVSNHVVRIAPSHDAAVRAGYMVTAMSHPTLSRPLLKSLAFGSSVPEIDADDIRAFEVVRLGTTEESVIADLAEAAAQVRAEADLLEHTLADDAGAVIERFTRSS